MPDRLSRRRCLRQLLGAGVGVTVGAAGGCGSILYPERIGQPSGPLDWKVVALDTAGLLLFFVPGVIAFAVDFYNGTIFLPTTTYASYSPGNRAELVPVAVEGAMEQERIEQVVSERAGQPVKLADGGYSARPLDNLDQFWPETWRLLPRADA